MHPIDQNKVEAITSYVKSTAIDLPKLHEQGSAARKPREALVQLTDLYQQHSENFSSDQQKIVAAYHRMAIALYKLYKNVSNNSSAP
jgi:hypothetical protein